MPAASSLTRASRSISDERSMPIACAGARAEQLDHPPGAGADVDQPAERRVLPKRALDRPLDLAFGDVERADRIPHFAHAPRNSARRPRRGRRGPPRAAPRPRRTAPCAGGVAQQSSKANNGSVRSGSASARNTQLPSLRRSTSPASARIRTWRETRGWLWPSSCASSPTDSSMPRKAPGSAAGWGRQAPGTGRQGGECPSLRKAYKEIFICVKRSIDADSELVRRSNARIARAHGLTCIAARRPVRFVRQAETSGPLGRAI